MSPVSIPAGQDEHELLELIHTCGFCIRLGNLDGMRIDIPSNNPERWSDLTGISFLKDFIPCILIMERQSIK